MEINLSFEMIKVIRAVLREHTENELKGYVAGWDPETEVSGVEALELFEELFQLSNLELLDLSKPYYVLIGGEWVRCKKARVTPHEWLEYELADGNRGLVPASRWSQL